MPDDRDDALSDWVAVRALRRPGPRRRGWRRGCAGHRRVAVYRRRVGLPGYWNRPELNARAFLDRDGRRWYNTGDVVRLDPNDGYVYLGRRDRMVKRRGYRIELGEIERGLYQHASIARGSGRGRLR